MTSQLPRDFDDAAELRACLRDLIALLGLPALWSSSRPEQTLRLLSETLVELLALDACAVVAPFSGSKEPLCALYADGKPLPADSGTDWLPFFMEAADAERHELNLTEEATPLGRLQVARFSLGYYGCEGQITVASRRLGFPRPTELVLLRAAASLAASGLRTARLAYEREQALRTKDEFLAMLGHELRNPLAPIVTALELIKATEGPRLTQAHVIIERQVHHLKRLVDDLLDVTRITAGKIEIQQQRVEVGTVVQTAVEAAQPLLRERRHQLVCDVPESGLLVKGDPLRLAQVATNLLINAAKYTEPGGTITITASRAAGGAVLQVQDSGIGIDPELLPRVFDLFEQGRMSIDRSHGGLGIGLSVVKSLVALHGGTVSAQSAGRGHGSTFTVTLPLVHDDASAAGPMASAASASAPGRTQCILLVDDNQDAVDSLGMLLEAYGYEVHLRYDPVEALLACETVQPNVVIVDIGLPVMDGYELADRIRARFAARPPSIIAVTGYGQPQDRQRSLKVGITAHLTKPVAIEVLLEQIQKAA